MLGGEAWPKVFCVLFYPKDVGWGRGLESVKAVKFCLSCFETEIERAKANLSKESSQKIKTLTQL